MRQRGLRRSGGGASIGLEPLERRRLLSAAAWPAVTEVAAPGGASDSAGGSSGAIKLDVVISGGHVKISQAAHGVVVKSQGISERYKGDIVEVSASGSSGDNDIVVSPTLNLNVVLQGGSGDDTLRAGGGNETLYAGSGHDSLVAGSGTDTLVDTSAARDTLAGGSGVDSFWAQNDDVVTDVTPAETALGAVHWLSATAVSTPAISSSLALSASPADATASAGAAWGLLFPRGGGGDCADGSESDSPGCGAVG
ncbi:MAG: hypothetical protein ABSH22_14935 [Tepidisphaeraceae bacterium]